MMPPVLAVLFGAFITIATCLAVGGLIVRDRLLALPVGAAIVSALVFVLVSCGWAYPLVLLALGVVLLVLGVRRGWAGEALPGYGRFWKALFWVVFALVGAICLLHALAPEVSPAGTRIYLADVMRRVPTQAASVEMLFLFAFAFGKHSAAALVSCAFLLTLALLILAYGRRAGLAKAGAFAAVFTLASPVVMVDGSSACPDVALACALFAMFGLLEKWDAERLLGHAVPIGLAGRLRLWRRARWLAGAALRLGFHGLARAPASHARAGGYCALRSRRRCSRAVDFARGDMDAEIAGARRDPERARSGPAHRHSRRRGRRPHRPAFPPRSNRAFCLAHCARPKGAHRGRAFFLAVRGPA